MLNLRSSKPLIIGALLITFGAFTQAQASTTPNSIATAAPCTNSVISQMTSSDKLWIATTYMETCSGNSAMETTVAVYVTLAPTSNAANQTDVFDFDTGGNDGLNPTFSWKSPHSLQISTIHSKYITLQKTSFSGVPISYTYHGSETP